jgi:transposase InsO family protein
VITASFRIFYIFVVLGLGTRRILHHNVTAHPTAERTLQQFRETLGGEHPYRFVIHDRDSMYSKALDQGLTNLGVRVLRTPVGAPLANSVCERFGGSLRRECLDFLIPLNERHLKMTVKEWGIPYNRGRPHSSLGPGIPETPERQSAKRPQIQVAGRLPRCENDCTRRLAPRVSFGGGRIMTFLVFAENTGRYRYVPLRSGPKVQCGGDQPP